MLSSHLLDEVERTCDAVAIVDRGNIIRQGPISELLAGASLMLQVECRSRSGPRALLAATDLGADVELGPSGLAITLPAGARRCHRGDRPPAGGRRDLAVPAPAGTGIAGVVVPSGHQPIGGPQ